MFSGPSHFATTNILALPYSSTQTSRMKGGWVYIVTNKRDGILYVGVTSDMRRRASEHRDGTYPGFSRKHGLKRLVYMESHDEIASAIARETRIKKWPRAWKVRMIHGFNPDWDDLYETLNY
jgi:putative endonuclease